MYCFRFMQMKNESFIISKRACAIFQINTCCNSAHMIQKWNEESCFLFLYQRSLKIHFDIIPTLFYSSISFFFYKQAVRILLLMYALSCRHLLIRKQQKLVLKIIIVQLDKNYISYIVYWKKNFIVMNLKILFQYMRGIHLNRSPKLIQF